MTSYTEPWHRQAWTSEALCAQIGGDLFFSEDLTGARQAKQTCLLRCPVQAQCREWALSQPRNEYGTWGGLSREERRKIRAERVAAGLLAPTTEDDDIEDAA